MTGRDTLLTAHAMTPQIGAQAVLPLAAAVRARSGDVERLFAELGLDAAVLADPDGRIPLAKLDGLWEAGARMTGDDCLGLHAAEGLSEGTFGLVSYLGLASPTLGDGLRRVCTFFRLLSDASGYQLDSDGGLATLTATQDVHSPAPVRQRVEFTVAVVHEYCGRHLETEWRPHDVFFEHPAPEETAEHARLFRSAPRFAAPASGFRFAASLLDSPLRSADQTLVTLLERLAGSLLAELPAVKTMVHELKSSLLEAGPGQDASLPAAAHRLKLSPRTLQRRLRDEGTSYQEVLDEVRSLWARRMLETDVGLAEVAFTLGFSEPAAFHRAFKRWTGQTPASFRRRA
jgi:AraC-like DNA-binding protein